MTAIICLSVKTGCCTAWLTGICVWTWCRCGRNRRDEKQKKKESCSLSSSMGLIAMTVVLMITLCLVITRQHRSSMESYYTKMAFDQAKIAAEYIDGDTIKDYALTRKTDSYYDQVSRYLLYMKGDHRHQVFLRGHSLRGPYVLYMGCGKDGEEGVCRLGMWTTIIRAAGKSWGRLSASGW